MGRFKEVMHRAINYLSRENRLNRSLRELACRSPKIEGLARRVGRHIREFRAEALTEKIEDRLRDTRDPKERMALQASIDTVKFLVEKEGHIPESLEELIRLQADLNVMKNRSCMERLTVLMSPQMLAHAARSEKREMKN